MTRGVRITKRVLDVVASLVGLALTLPFYPVLAAVIRIDSPGPILFRQKRVGRFVGLVGGRLVCSEFEMIKFRTMRSDAERTSGAVLASPDDPRVTRLGRFLRRSRLDELPQFWNVLRGDMSLVGPRPERRELFENLALAIPYFEERLRNVKPGITGLAQVSLGYNGRPPAHSEIARHLDALTNPFKLIGAEDSDADHMRIKLLYDLAYAGSLEQFSTFVRTDASVIARTPWVMLMGHGY